MELWLGGGLLLLLFMLGKSSSSSNGGGESVEPPSGGGDDKPPSKVPSRRRGAGGRGQVWGSDADTSKLPSAGTFDYSGNGLWIDPNCGFVIEGDQFWPKKGAEVWVAVSAPTLDAALAKRGASGGLNSVLGYVDYLVDELGIDNAVDIMWRIVDEAAPMCAQVEPEQWGEAMRIWFNDLRRRIEQYLEEDTIGGFG